MKLSPYTMHTISFVLMLMAFATVVFAYPPIATVLLVMGAITLGILAYIVAKRNLDAAQRSRHDRRWR